MTKTLDAAIAECRKYITRGTRIPNNGDLGFHPTLYRDTGKWRIPVRVFFYNDPDGMDDETEFCFNPHIFDKAVEEDSEDLFWGTFSDELTAVWDEFVAENNLNPGCVREVAILY